MVLEPSALDSTRLGTAIDRLFSQASEFALATIEMISKANKRTLNQLTAKVYFYLARTFELQGKLSDLRSSV